VSEVKVGAGEQVKSDQVLVVVTPK